MGDGVVTRAKKRRLGEEEEGLDRISRLSDDILGDIVALLPTKDVGRTQILSSRWRHIWPSAPLSINLYGDPDSQSIPRSEISRILPSHRGPGRRFSIPMGCAAATLDGWLQSPALDGLQKLQSHLGHPYQECPPPPLPASARRFSGTLRAVSFGGCSFPDGDDSVLHLPVLKQLTLSHVRISEASLHALLAGCPVLQSLLLLDNYGFPRLKIVSPSLRSIGVCSDWRDLRLQQLVIVDAPCLERLLYFRGMEMDISIVSAPRLYVLGHIYGNFPRLHFGGTGFPRSRAVSSLAAAVCGMKVLALRNVHLNLDAVIDLMKCSPRLETLYIETGQAEHKNSRCHKHRDLIGTLDIGLKKIVVTNYQGNMSHVNFAKFFVLNARLLESIRLELEDIGNVSKAWIERQHRLLQIQIGLLGVHRLILTYWLGHMNFYVLNNHMICQQQIPFKGFMCRSDSVTRLYCFLFSLDQLLFCSVLRLFCYPFSWNLYFFSNDLVLQFVLMEPSSRYVHYHSPPGCHRNGCNLHTCP